jgi:predicted ribosomally synthesized peptide with nif11-like leader
MMKESVAKFFEVVRQDEKLAERLRTFSENPDHFSRLSSELGRERGFEFEAADVQNALAALSAQAETGLTEEQLRNVAGGVSMPNAEDTLRLRAEDTLSNPAASAQLTKVLLSANFSAASVTKR